jgi:hypothetical protein
MHILESYSDRCCNILFLHCCLTVHRPCITGREAGQFFLECMVNHQGNLPLLPTKQRPIGKTCFNWFRAMATDEELLLLNRGPDGDRGAQRLTVKNIETMVVANLRDLFESANPPIKLARDLILVSPKHPKRTLLATGIHSRLVTLTKKNFTEKNLDGFRTWRTAYEAAAPAAAVGTSRRQASGQGQGSGKKSRHT